MASSPKRGKETTTMQTTTTAPAQRSPRSVPPSRAAEAFFRYSDARRRRNARTGRSASHEHAGAGYTSTLLAAAWRRSR